MVLLKSDASFHSGKCSVRVCEPGTRNPRRKLGNRNGKDRKKVRDRKRRKREPERGIERGERERKREMHLQNLH